MAACFMLDTNICIYLRQNRLAEVTSRFLQMQHGDAVMSVITYGEIRAALESRGESIGGSDLWIAAHVKSAGLPLVTKNEREFKRVPGLKLQNWSTPGPH